MSLQCAHADNVMHNTYRYFLPHTSAQQLHVAGATRRKGSLQKPRTRRAGKQILTQVFLVGGSQIEGRVGNSLEPAVLHVGGSAPTLDFRNFAKSAALSGVQA